MRKGEESGSLCQSRRPEELGGRGGGWGEAGAQVVEMGTFTEKLSAV